jgi:FlaA1/EpsC-like NDP-sugar epimerase
MISQRKRIFAVNLWLVDLVLTTASFYLAYRLRLFVELQGYTVLPLREYLWLLAIILPVWAVILPLFRVYSDLTSPPFAQIVRLTKGIFVSWLTVLAAQFFVSQGDAFSRHRLIAVFTLVINYVFLVAYRILLIRLKKHGALDIRHVAVVGSGAGAQDFARQIREHHMWGLQLVGVFEHDHRSVATHLALDLCAAPRHLFIMSLANLFCAGEGGGPDRRVLDILFASWGAGACV